MSQTVVVNEFGIIVAAKDLQPHVITLELLKYIGAIPTEWELVRPPINTKNFSQLIFTSGISIIAEQKRIIFIEAYVPTYAVSLLVPGIASKFVSTLPNVEYKAVGLNPRGYVPFNQQDANRKYLTETLLTPGAWQEIGNAPIRAELNLAYTLDGRMLYLTVNEATVQNPDETTSPIVMFNGNFSYDLAGETGSERLTSLHTIIDNWQADLETYQEIINTKFLFSTPENITSIPDLFRMNASASAL